MAWSLYEREESTASEILYDREATISCEKGWYKWLSWYREAERNALYSLSLACLITNEENLLPISIAMTLSVLLEMTTLRNTERPG